MQINELKAEKFKGKKRIGRGGKRGTYSGKGVKGQRSRAGANFQPLVREWLKKYPKLRGYNFNLVEAKPAKINLSEIEKIFKDKDIVSPKTLFKKNLIRKTSGRLPIVKILGNGEITKGIVVRECLVSNSAKEKIEKQKGKICSEN